MSLLSLVFNKTQRTRLESTTNDGSIVMFEIDATISMNHERSANPTKNPVESGVNVADHVTLENNRLSIEGIVTNNPLTLIQSITSLLGERALENPLNVIEAPQTIFRQVGTIARMLNNNESRVENAFRYLEEIHQNREPFTIITGLKKYDNMILTNLSIPQTAQDGDSIRFNATFEQITTVQTIAFLSEKKIKPTARSVKHSANKATKSGKKQAKKTTEKVKVRSSALFKVFKAVRD